MKHSSTASQVTQRTLRDSASKILSAKSGCNVRETSVRFEPHLTRFILAFDMISEASRTILQHPQMESAPDRKSSTYIFPSSSSATWDARNKAKWDWTVTFKRKWLLQFANGTLLNFLVLMSTSASHKNDIHLGLPYTHLSGEKLSQYLQWWHTASVGTETKSPLNSPTSMDWFPYNRSKRCYCNS